VRHAGNLGPEQIGLRTDKDKLCTWLSRDGGITWTDVIDDVYIYEFLNHGNIIALAKFRCVWFSSLSWNACGFLENETAGPAVAVCVNLYSDG
jgi:hypothetical protein